MSRWGKLPLDFATHSFTKWIVILGPNDCDWLATRIPMITPEDDSCCSEFRDLILEKGGEEPFRFSTLSEG